MKMTITEYDFINAFENMNRAENFSRAGLSTLFEMLEEYEESTGEEMELDVIGICCQFSEYTIDELINDYDEIKESLPVEWASLEGEEKRQALDDTLCNLYADYRWIDDGSLIFNVESI